MKLAIVGATGGVGRQLVTQALAAGHAVTALARRPEAVTERHPALKVVVGDVLQPASLQQAFAGQDAVLSGLGARSLAFRRFTMLSDGCRNMLAAMAATHVRRLVLVTSAGLERVDPQFPFFYRWLLRPLLLQRFYDDHARVEALLRESPVEWVAVRPYYLDDGPKTGAFRGSERFLPQNPRTISRADTAGFMLEQLTSKAWVNKTPTLAG